MKTLNDIPENLAAENAVCTADLLREVLADPPAEGSPGARSFHERAGRLALELGLYHDALEDEPAEVRRHFREAAKHLARGLALRPPPKPNENRGLWQAELWISLVAAVGDADDRAAVVGLEPWQYRNPVRPEQDALAAYLGAVRKSLGGSPADPAALAGVVRWCDSPAASKEDRRFVRPGAEALLALGAGDAGNWNLALARILSSHGEEAREGDLRLLPEGFVSFQALALARFGIARGFRLRAQSDYLPAWLIEGGPAG